MLPIIEETTTNIYFPSPFCQDENQQDLKAVIYITGEQTQVTRVKEMLNKLAVQKVNKKKLFPKKNKLNKILYDTQAKSMYHKDTELSARKIDWLLLYRRDELRKIMHDNGK